MTAWPWARFRAGRQASALLRELLLQPEWACENTVALVVKIAIAIINHVVEAQKLDMKLYRAVLLVPGAGAAC